MSGKWRNESVSIDTEDKHSWCAKGEVYERQFVDYMSKHSCISISINPKKEKDPTAPDLYVPGYGECDLKVQQTPFFSAKKFGIRPEVAFTFNNKDVIRYRKMYPDIGIFIWLSWENNMAPNSRFEPVEYRWGVYFTTIREILGIIDTGIAKCHEYERRKQANNSSTSIGKIGMNSDKNATSSYVLSSEWITPVLASSSDPWKV